MPSSSTTPRAAELPSACFAAALPRSIPNVCSSSSALLLYLFHSPSDTDIPAIYLGGSSTPSLPLSSSDGCTSSGNSSRLHQQQQGRLTTSGGDSNNNCTSNSGGGCVSDSSNSSGGCNGDGSTSGGGCDSDGSTGGSGSGGAASLILLCL